MTEQLSFRNDKNNLIVSFSGRITSSNAPEIDRELRSALAAQPHEMTELDFDRLEYISSAGLRIILKLKQDEGSVRIVNAHSNVYEILDMTGFTDLMEVRRAYRVLSVKGCQTVGEGANGKVYRIDPETLVKVYRNPDALEEIHREQELARTAFVAGVPTAISYDVVRIEGGGYGSVFELLNADSLARLLARGEKTVEEEAELAAGLLHRIHSLESTGTVLPDMKQTALKWADDLKSFLPSGRYEKLRALIDAVPRDIHMLHGDFHLKNILYQNGEALLIDMDTLCHGHPVFDLAGMYNAHCGFGIADSSNVESFLDLPIGTAMAFWRRCLEKYLGTDDPITVQNVEDKARILGYTRIIRRSIRRNALGTPEGRTLISRCEEELFALLDRMDSLTF